jgi:membrane protease YdiL (CAAX protease family)
MTAPAQKTNFRAVDAWYCALALIVTDALVVFWIRFAAKHSFKFYYFWESTTGSICSVLIQGFLWFFWALWFSRVSNTRELFFKVGLNKKINLYGYVAAWVAFLIALFSHCATSYGWVTAVKNVNHIDHDELVGFYYFFFAAKTIALMPFIEEVTTRGFIYSALREKYKMPLCIFLIIAFASYFHRSLITSSSFEFLILVLFVVLLCIVRENTNSLWNCILCHGVYNAAAIQLWYPVMIFMICLLPFVLFGTRADKLREKLDSPEKETIG